MPATQHDAVLWLAGAAYDVVFDEARGAIAALAPVAQVAVETSSWPYRHDRDLTGFIDGTENPSLARAPDVAVIPPGEPGAGGSVLLLQRWAHDVEAWEALPVPAQETAMGRTKHDSIELTQARQLPRRRAPIRTTSATSSAATCRTARSPPTGRCSSASPPTRARSRACSTTWPASTAPATS